MTQDANGDHREANVVLELRVRGPISEEVLDANADVVFEAVVAHAADVALGPAVAVSVEEATIKLRFDLVATTDVEVHEKVGDVLATIARETGLELESMRSEISSA